MASGCVYGNCSKCNELLWEDDDIVWGSYPKIYHVICPENELFTEWQEQRIRDIVKEMMGK